MATKSVLAAATGLLDRLLLVLIVAEIVHTVVLSLRAHRLVAQPFIIVGLVAVIRKILLVLSSEASLDTTQLWLLIAMVVAFVAGLIAVSRFKTVLAREDDPRNPPAGPGGRPPGTPAGRGRAASRPCPGMIGHANLLPWLPTR
jgi:uncharacterized membrane protein (DUF373 family)